MLNNKRNILLSKQHVRCSSLMKLVLFDFVDFMIQRLEGAAQAPQQVVNLIMVSSCILCAQLHVL